MENKIDIIKKVLLLDTKKEIDSVLRFVADAISRECDQDELDKKTFEHDLFLFEYLTSILF